MKLRYFVSVLTLFLASFAVGHGEVVSGQNAPLKDEFRFEGYKITERFVQLNYYLPFAGVVELRIYTEAGEMVWQGQYLKERGEQSTRLKTAAFTLGEAYTFQLNYKEDIFRKTLKIIP